MPKPSPRSWRQLGLAILVAFVATGCGEGFEADYAAIREMQLAQRAERFGPGRIAGAPWQAPKRRAVREPLRQGSETGAATRGASANLLTPLENAHRGFKYLVSGTPVDADMVASFESAFAAGKDDPGYLNDYAAALLERGQPSDVILAGESSARALEIAEADDPAGELSRVARFHWALALERLALHDQATKAWQAVLATETDAGWRAEAEGHLAELATWPVARWPRVRAEVRAAAAQGDTATVAALLPEFRTAIRLLAEDEELEVWAEAVESDPIRAQEALAIARTIGAVLAQNGDEFLYDVVAGVDAARGDVQTTVELAAAFRGFYRGLAAYKAFAYTRSREVLHAAGARLEVLGSPLAFRARFFDLASSGQLGLAEQLDRIEEYQTGLPEVYAVLVAQASYLEGRVSLNAGFAERSLAPKRVAVAALAALGEGDLEAGYRSNLASALDQAFLEEEAEPERGLATRKAQRIVAPYYRWTVASGVESKSGELEAWRVRLAALRETGRLAEEHPIFPSLIAEAKSLEFETLELLGRSAEAARALAAAEQAIAALDDPEDRVRSRADLLRSELATPVRSGQKSRLTLIGEALAGYEAAELREQLVLQRIGLLIQQSEMVLREEDFSAARVVAEEAFDLLARRAGGVEDRRGLAAKVRPVADLRLRAGLDYPEATDSVTESFRWLERGHHLSAPVTWSEPAALAEVTAGLPAGASLAAMTSLSGAVVVIVVGEHGAERHFLSPGVSGAELSCLDLRMGQSCEPSWMEVARRVAMRVVEPWLCRLPPGERLVLVPGPLARIPFSGLPIHCPGEAEQPLVERHATSLSPSATFWLAAHRRARELATQGPARSLLAVGVENALGFEGKPLLRARGEAEALVALYEDPATRLLLEGAATKGMIADHLGGSDVVHFATHGVIDARNPAGSYLALVADRLAADDLGALSKSNQTRLAVLAACDTGGGAEGAEGLVGVSRAFLEIGIPTVVATLGPVSDVYAPRVMREFHEEYRRTGDAAAALAAAQRKAAREGGALGENDGGTGSFADGEKEKEKESQGNQETGPPEWAKWVVVG